VKKSQITIKNVLVDDHGEQMFGDKKTETKDTTPNWDGRELEKEGI